MGVWIEPVATVESLARNSRSNGSRSPSSLLYDHGGYLCGDLAVCGNSDRSQDNCRMAGRSILAHRVASRGHCDASVRSAAQETSLSPQIGPILTRIQHQRCVLLSRIKSSHSTQSLIIPS